MELTDSRWLLLDGAYNVRDLGGLPDRSGGRTAAGRLLRADALDLLTAADVEALVDGFGVRHVVDLRSAAERAERGRGQLGQVSGVRYTEVEVIPEDALARRRDTKAAQFAAGVDPDVIMAEGYVELLELGAPAFASAIAALVELDGSPALFHCTAGKDRTGILAALLLQLAGVDDEAIAADYALTDERMPGIIERITGATSFEALAAQVPAFSFQAKAPTMLHFLRALGDRWGGATGYLAAIGADEATIEAARRLLLP